MIYIIMMILPGQWPCASKLSSKYSFFQAEIVRKKGKNLLSDPIFNKVKPYLIQSMTWVSDIDLTLCKFSFRVLGSQGLRGTDLASEV